MKAFYGAVMGLAMLVMATGCQEGMRADAGPDFNMRSSHRQVLAGETVTFTTTTANTLGRNSEIRWHATGGEEIRTSADNRVAQITFQEPGMHSVSADLYVEGTRVRTQTASIEVQPLSQLPGGYQIHRDLQPQGQQAGDEQRPQQRNQNLQRDDDRLQN